MRRVELLLPRRALRLGDGRQVSDIIGLGFKRLCLVGDLGVPGAEAKHTQHQQHTDQDDCAKQAHEFAKDALAQAGFTSNL
jgi:hypothetical protein